MRAALAGLGTFALLALASPGLACGPFVSAVRFDAPPLPDTAPAAFRAGNLGILRGNLPEADLLVAWRHLMGLGAPPAAARPRARAWHEVLEGWRRARAALQVSEARIDQYSPVGDEAFHLYPRVHDAAIVAATEILLDRTARHPAEKEALRAWVAGQDAVFSSTRVRPAIPEPVDGPPWLRADRDYQRAAALFYAERFDEALAAFAAVDRDPSSPWRPWGRCLMARCLVRGASLAAPPGEPPAVEPYREAAELLAGVLRDGPRDHPVRQAARDYLELVEHRTSPGELLLRAAAALTSRPPVDLDRAIGLWASARDACARAGTPPPALPAAAADLQRWLEIMTTKEGGAFEAALARHARDPSLPWLVAALVRAPAGDERVEALPAQAGRVPSDSPAAATLRWQRIRLRAWGIGELDAASREPLPRWAVNEVRARRSALASSIVDWGTTAPRLPTLRSEFGDPFLPVPGDAPKDEGLWDWTEAQTVNRRLELARLRELAATPSIPPLLARELRRAVWTRAVLLERWDDAAAAARELEGDLGRQARSALDAPDPLERGFRLARLGMSRHPRVDSGHPVR